MVIYITFLHDVACQKLLKSGNVSRSYSKNNTGTVFYHAMLAQSAVMRLLSSVCLSVCPSVCSDQVPCASRLELLKIISPPNSLRSMRSLTPNIGNLVHWEHPKN